MTTWLTSTRKRSSKRNSTSVIGFGPKNGVQATSSSSRGDSSSPSSSRKTLPMSGTGPCWYQGFQTFFHFKWLTINAKTHKEILEPQTCKHLKSTHGFSEVHVKCNVHKPLKKASLWPPRCPAEIYAQKQCLHFFTILLTAMSERWLYLRWKSSQTRDWWTQSFQST